MIKDMLGRLRVRLGPHGAEIIRLHEALDGQILLEESAFLFRAAAGMTTIVEIGSYRGKSCVMLARGAITDRPSTLPPPRVHAIDPHVPAPGRRTEAYGMSDHETLLAAVQRHGVSHVVEPVVLTSQAAAARWDDTPIDLLWVDGDHTYPHVRFDLGAWAPKVRVGGLAAAHDCRKGSDVERAWSEEMTEANGWGPRGKARSIAWARRLR